MENFRIQYTEREDQENSDNFNSLSTVPGTQIKILVYVILNFDKGHAPNVY